MKMRCRYRRQASGLLTVAFLLFIASQMIVFQNQRPIDTIDDIHSIKEGRRLFGENPVDEQVPGVFHLQAHSKALVNYVYKMISLPSSDEYNLTYPHLEDFSRGQCEKIDDFLNKTENGFFVEIGASDGEKQSVSLFFERQRHWNGLLVEPNPEKYKKLLGKNRHALSLQACIKTNKTGPSKEYSVSLDHSVYVPCVWMETLFMAVGRKIIDLLVINVNSLEHDILDSIPFDKFNIRTMSIEFTRGSDDQMNIIKYLMKKGYHAYHQFSNHLLRKTDLLFVKVLEQ